MSRGVIFSDVDGTFLDAAGAVPFPAEFLASVTVRWRVIFASSRTGAQLSRLQAQVGWRDWGIAEDGSVLVSPAGEEELLGLPRAEIIARLRHAGAWEGVRDLLPATAVVRHASVLLPRAVAEDPAFSDFRARSLSVDLRCSAGGGWATLTGNSDKSRAAMVLMKQLGASEAAAIGNDANDEPLLRAASRSFVVRNAHGYHPRLAMIPGATLLQAPGPLGWKEMIGALQQPR